MILKRIFKSETNSSKRFVQNILAKAGIEINGKNPWDIQVHDERFYNRVIKNPSLGAGESYMDGWWDCDHLDELFSRLLAARLYQKFSDWWSILSYIKNRVINLQTLNRSLDVARMHYDLDTQLYAAMLGSTMAYTCGYWENVNNLDDAQNNKYDLICRKLALQKNDNVLELGCGFGGFARFAATYYGCKITAVNISVQQIEFAKGICSNLPIKLFQTDYRKKSIYNPDNIQFDKVVSIGMFEHVGRKNYHEFMEIVYSQLKNHGLFLLHTIGNNTTVSHLDPWIDKYIFPNGLVPSIQDIGTVLEKFFIMEDWHNFGPDYDNTLMAWYMNFQKHWGELSSRYDERFYRMWIYYLLSCAGMFRAREAQLWQLILSKGRGQKKIQRIRKSSLISE